jgi:hypothetical protein
LDDADELYEARELWKPKIMHVLVGADELYKARELWNT